MSEEFNKKKSLAERLKNLKINRSAVISAGALTVAVVIISVAAIASNRSKKGTVEQPDINKPDTEQTAPVTPPADNSVEKPQKDTPTVKPSNTESATVEDKLPSFVLPVSGALSLKHDADCQVFSNTMNDYRVHLGVDVVTESLAPVYAAADGKIDKIWEDTLMGYCIAIKHSGDCYTIYKNLAETLPDGIAEGVSVRSGQLIASVGESAMVEIAEEPHLHFEMTVAGLSVDPLEYFDENALQTLKIDASHGE
ncbi:MAG: M23 family metallopeptidase [Clostridia bacterium]|nr:M23 family metallopeptidase [Clostridia bacterium]